MFKKGLDEGSLHNFELGQNQNNAVPFAGDMPLSDLGRKKEGLGDHHTHSCSMPQFHISFWRKFEVDDGLSLCRKHGSTFDVIFRILQSFKHNLSSTVIRLKLERMVNLAASDCG